MDLEIVMNAISNHCKNIACQKEIGKAIKTYCRKLFQGFPVSAVPRPFYQDPKVEYKDFYNSMEISSAEYPILQNYLSNKYKTLKILPEKFENRKSSLMKIDDNSHETKTMLNNRSFTESFEKMNKYENTECKLNQSGKWNTPQSSTVIEYQRNKNEALWLKSHREKQYFFNSLSLRSKNENELKLSDPSDTFSIPSALMVKKPSSFTIENAEGRRSSNLSKLSSRKPRNLHEFKKQLKDAHIYPGIYPAIFTDPKAQFLSALGLVPKQICSKKILTKFTREQRKKRLMEKRRSWFVVERKVLRDRNKLKRNSHRLKMRREIYGSLSKSHSSSFRHSSSQNFQDVRNYDFKKLKNIAQQPLRGDSEKSKMIKSQFLLPKKRIKIVKKNPEVIDLASSDDENSAYQNLNDIKIELPDPQDQSTTSTKQNCSFQYADPRLFGCNLENDEAVRNQMFYQQNFGYNGVFLNQNNTVNFPVTSNSPYQLNNPFYINTQTQFPILRPFLVPTLSNNDIAALQTANFPMTPLRPMNAPNINPYYENMQNLAKNTSSNSRFPENLAAKNNLFAPKENIVAGNQETGTADNLVSHQSSQPPTNFKIFLVNKTPKKTYLLVPPNYKTYLNTVNKIIPIPDQLQSIEANMKKPDKVTLKYKTMAQRLKKIRLNKALHKNTNYSKQNESKKDFQSEMTRLSNWIRQLKSSVTPTNFQKGVDKFSHRLTNQLNVGITLVKDARNALIEIEQNEESAVEDA